MTFNTTRTRAWVLAALMLAIVSCTPDDAGIVTLAKVDGWRPGFEDSYGFAFVIIEVASTRAQIEQAWHENVPDGLRTADDPADGPGVYVQIDELDPATHALVVYSSGESGSCPDQVTKLTTAANRIEVELEHVGGPAMACTDDFRPFRLLLAVPHDQLPDELPVERIDLPARGLTDVEGRAVAYPRS